MTHTVGRIPIDMTGQVIGQLTILGRGTTHRAAGGKTFIKWLCRCSCGKEVEVKASKLRGKKPPLSCGCSRYLSLEEQLYVAKKYAALRRKIGFTLSLQEFLGLVVQDCHYCGRPPSNNYKCKKGVISYNGIDRKHNDEDYIPGNCLPCCSHCNSMKLDLSYEDFIEKIRLLYYRLCN